MPISERTQISIDNSSWIRKMFEVGIALKKEVGDDNVFDYTIGNPDIAPPEKFYQVIEKLAADRDPKAHAYMPNAGYPHVREKMAEKTAKEQGVALVGENIVMTVGSASGLNVVFKTLLNIKEEVVVPLPYFGEYLSYTNNNGGKLVTVSARSDFSLDPEQIRKNLTDKTRIVLINSPNNPCGRIYTEEDLKALAAILKERRDQGQFIYLVSDESYRDLAYDGVEVPAVLPLYDESFVLVTFSKALSLAGERIGYIAQNPKMTDRALIMDGLIACNRTLGYVNAPAIMQKAVAELIEEHADLKEYKERRDNLTAIFDECGLEYIPPEGTFYIFVKSPIADDLQFCEHLRKFNILAVPGVGFGGPGYVRISYSAISVDTIKRSRGPFLKAMAEL